VNIVPIVRAVVAVAKGIAEIVVFARRRRRREEEMKKKKKSGKGKPC